MFSTSSSILVSENKRSESPCSSAHFLASSTRAAFFFAAYILFHFLLLILFHFLLLILFHFFLFHFLLLILFHFLLFRGLLILFLFLLRSPCKLVSEPFLAFLKALLVF